VEIWRGTFSPGEKKRILIMPGVQMSAKTKAVYAKEDVYPLAFKFYISKADALMHNIEEISKMTMSLIKRLKT